MLVAVNLTCVRPPGGRADAADAVDKEPAMSRRVVRRLIPEATIGRLDEAVAELAGEIASKGPAFVAAGKRLFYRQIEDGAQSY